METFTTTTTKVTKHVEKKPKKSKIEKDEKKPKKTRIPKALRMKLWEVVIRNVLVGKCYACDREIKVDSFEAGHIVSEKNGGTVDITNLKPVCKPCNTSCGTLNLDEFKSMLKVETIKSHVKDEPVKVVSTSIAEPTVVNTFKTGLTPVSAQPYISDNRRMY